MMRTTFGGSCLCGTVCYEVTGEPRGFFHCHCSRCRKSSGAAHGTSLAIAGDALRWIGGEAQLGYYKLPDAERFARQFCKVCGSPVPRVDAELGVVIIPAGSLDSDIDSIPEARIFWNSRASWSCSGDGLKVYPEYPPPV